MKREKEQFMSSMTLSPSAVQSSSTTRVSRTINWKKFTRVGAATAVAASLANVAVYYIGDTVIRYDPKFVELGNAFGIAIMTLVPAVIAALLYSVLLRRSENPVRAFSIISAVVFVVALIPDFTMAPTDPGASNSQIAVLILMHVVAAAVIVRSLTKFARPGSSSVR
jgi:hypothetical protein